MLDRIRSRRQTITALLMCRSRPPTRRMALWLVIVPKDPARLREIDGTNPQPWALRHSQYPSDECRRSYRRGYDVPLSSAKRAKADINQRGLHVRFSATSGHGLGHAVSKEARARPSRLHHSATCLKNICLIGIKAGSHWTIKDVSIDAGSISNARPNASANSLVRSCRKCKPPKREV